MTEGSPGGAHYPQPQTFHVSQIKPEHSSPLCPLSNPSPPAWLIDCHPAGIVQRIRDMRRCSCGHQFLVNWEGQHMFFHHACFSRSVLGWSAVPSYPPATYQLLWKWLHLIPKWSSLLCHSFSYLRWQHTSDFVINVFFDCVLTTLWLQIAFLPLTPLCQPLIHFLWTDYPQISCLASFSLRTHHLLRSGIFIIDLPAAHSAKTRILKPESTPPASDLSSLTVFTIPWHCSFTSSHFLLSHVAEPHLYVCLPKPLQRKCYSSVRSVTLCSNVYLSDSA